MDRLEAVTSEIVADWCARVAGPGAVSGDDLVRLRTVVNRLEAAFTGGVRVFDRSQEWTVEGAVSAAAWLRGHCGLSAPEAHQRVSVGRELERMPSTQRAFESGEISYGHARVLAGPVDANTEEAFRGVEEALVGVARACSPAELRRVVEYWRVHLDGDRGAGVANDRYDKRRLHVSPTLAGMVAIDGLLDPEGGEIVLTALQGLIDAGREAPGEPGGPGEPGEPRRSMPQMRADALVEACRAVLDGRVPVTRGGERPHISVVVSLEALSRLSSPATSGSAGGPGVCGVFGGSGAYPGADPSTSVAAVGALEAFPLSGGREFAGAIDPLGCWRCEAAHVGPVSPETVLRWACDAGVSRVITGARGEPLDVGRQRRTVTGAQRRALVVRDGGCRFPGCDRPPAWTVPHHLWHWADGGPTAIDNLVLLCHRHHRMVHEGRWKIEIDGDGQVSVRAPEARARGPSAGIAA